MIRWQVLWIQAPMRSCSRSSSHSMMVVILSSTSLWSAMHCSLHVAHHADSPTIPTHGHTAQCPRRLPTLRVAVSIYPPGRAAASRLLPLLLFPLYSRCSTSTTSPASPHPPADNPYCRIDCCRILSSSITIIITIFAASPAALTNIPPSPIITITPTTTTATSAHPPPSPKD